MSGVDVAGRAVLIGERHLPYDQRVIATDAVKPMSAMTSVAAATCGLESIYFFIGFRNRMTVAVIDWLWSYLTCRRGAV